MMYCGQLELHGFRSEAKALQQLLQDLGVRWPTILHHNVQNPSTFLSYQHKRNKAKKEPVAVKNGIIPLLVKKEPDPLSLENTSLVVKHENNLETENWLSETEAKALKPKKKRLFMADLKESQLTCDICFKVFKKLYRLKNHQLIHQGRLDLWHVISQSNAYVFMFGTF